MRRARPIGFIFLVLLVVRFDLKISLLVLPFRIVATPMTDHAQVPEGANLCGHLSLAPYPCTPESQVLRNRMNFKSASPCSPAAQDHFPSRSGPSPPFDDVE